MNPLFNAKRRATAVAAVIVLIGTSAPHSLAQDDRAVEVVDEAITGGDLAGAVKTLEKYVEQSPDSGTARFGLGMARFLRTSEELLQSLYRHGFGEPIRMMTGMVLPGVQAEVPLNPNPEPIGYSELRDIIAQWQQGIEEAEKTLAAIPSQSPVKLPIHVGLIRIDLNADGETTEGEAFWEMFRQMQARYEPTEQTASEFVIAFDRGDVEWLRGYCHIMLAAADLDLAHEWEELFNHTAHLFFPKPQTPFDFLKHGAQSEQQSEMMFVDVAAFIHLMHAPVQDAERLKSAHGHVLQAVSHSRAMWEFFDAETDNDQEWIPNPDQDAAIPDAQVTPEIKAAWLEFLDMAAAILEGDRLLPFWRGGSEEIRGVNLRRVFYEPRPFDLILWVQGTALSPYLEKGDVVDRAFWTRMNTAMDHQFFRFAAWFN